MAEFIFGFFLGVVITVHIVDIKNTPNEPVCTMESGDSFWTRKKQEVHCTKAEK